MIPIKPLNLSDFYEMLSGARVTIFDSTPHLLKAASTKSQFISAIPCNGERKEIKNMSVLNANTKKTFLLWIQKNQIFASAILLSLAMIISIVIYACSTRYYLNSRCGVVLDRWTGKVTGLR